MPCTCPSKILPYILYNFNLWNTLLCLCLGLGRTFLCEILLPECALWSAMKASGAVLYAPDALITPHSMFRCVVAIFQQRTVLNTAHTIVRAARGWLFRFRPILTYVASHVGKLKTGCVHLIHVWNYLVHAHRNKHGLMTCPSPFFVQIANILPACYPVPWGWSITSSCTRPRPPCHRSLSSALSASLELEVAESSSIDSCACACHEVCGHRGGAGGLPPGQSYYRAGIPFS